MANSREHIYLAALLHDIGKFYQRADKKFADKENELSEYSKNLANDICPINDNGQFGYQHVVWTNEFFEKFKQILEQIPNIKQNIWENEDANGDCIANFACNHHRPKSKLQGIITLADWWSAGIDRQNAKEWEDEQPNENIKWGKDRYKQIPLYSIFNGINKGKGCSAFSLRPLSLDENDFFPKEIKSKSDGVNNDLYTTLWNNFTTEFKKLPTDSYNGFVESLLSLLKRFTWCIPSNTNDMSNVSLFDHLKTTAAFANCFYQYDKEYPDALQWNGSANKLTICDSHKPVLLVGGDLSGIQKFIYNIASRKAAVSLKGRSFYLQLLIDSVIQRIISHEEIDSTIGQVVYSSGGKFYMLLPNTDKIKKALYDLKLIFEKELWEKHNGQLILNLDYVPFAYSSQTHNLCFGDIDNGTIGDLWAYLANKLTDNKNHKFKSILLSSFDTLFNPQQIAADANICAVTGIEGKCVKIDEKEKKEPTFVLPIVKKQTILGSVLKDADYVITYKDKESSKYLCNRSKCEIEIADTFNYLFDKKELTDSDADFRQITSTDVSRVKMINQLNFLDAQIKGQKVSYGFQFYGGNKQAQIFDKDKNESRNKTFEELSDNTYLGVLRMDVDGLGSIFIKGLPNDAKSFSAYSTLSFMLDYFFSGYLNTIREKYNNDVNILYSGGDDIFAVGRWDKLILFAEDIRKDFAKFVGREDISISGGITIISDKFPISKAAELAGNAEDSAKKFNEGKKNAFNLFGENISWKEEFQTIKTWRKKFFDLCDNQSMSRSILHKLMQYYSQIKHNKENLKYGKKEDFSFYWHSAYFLSRFAERYSKNQEIVDLCNELKNDKLINNGDNNFKLIALAARWAELELRFSDKNSINN